VLDDEARRRGYHATDCRPVESYEKGGGAEPYERLQAAANVFEKQGLCGLGGPQRIKSSAPAQTCMKRSVLSMSKAAAIYNVLSGNASVEEREEMVRWIGLSAANRKEYEDL